MPTRLKPECRRGHQFEILRVECSIGFGFRVRVQEVISNQQAFRKALRNLTNTAFAASAFATSRLVGDNKMVLLAPKNEPENCIY